MCVCIYTRRAKVVGDLANLTRSLFLVRSAKVFGTNAHSYVIVTSMSPEQFMSSMTCATCRPKFYECSYIFIIRSIPLILAPLSSSRYGSWPFVVILCPYNVKNF